MRRIFAAVLALALCVGCERLYDKGTKESIAAADRKSKAGDYRGAITLYEAALDGTSQTAEVHYRMAVIYDEKLRSPLDALHHFERYLALAPKGQFAQEALAYKKEGDLKLLNSMNKGVPMSQEEAVKLKNDNLFLRKQIVELRAQKGLAVPGAKNDPKAPIPPGTRTHVVQSGETLAAISQKYYKTRNRSQDILDANHNLLGGKNRIIPGQILIIPK
jgi:nucleoid-associated protein YgaU